MYRSENSSNTELSTSLGNVSQCLDMLKTQVDSLDNLIKAADKKAQEALDEVAKIITKHTQVDVKLSTLDETIKKEVSEDLDEE